MTIALHRREQNAAYRLAWALYNIGWAILNQIATIFPHTLTFEQILDLPRQFTDLESFPTLVCMSKATQPAHWTIPEGDKYPDLRQQWHAGRSLSLESVDQRIVLVFLKTCCIVDGWISLERFLLGGAEWNNSRETYRALCREVADRLGVSSVLHTGFSRIPWYTLETSGLDVSELVEVIVPQCACAVDDFENFVIYPSK